MTAMCQVIRIFIRKWGAINTDMKKGIFFDLDGVLVDSEPIHMKQEAEYLKHCHLDHLIERLPMMIGTHKGQDPWRILTEGEKLPGTLEEFKEGLYRHKQEVLSAIHFSDYLFKDVKETLKELKKRGCKLACASSSSKQYILEILQEGEILEYFDLIVSGDEFTRSKPDPEIYHHCRHYFGLKKEECLVIEDSPMGIEAGKNAGLEVGARRDRRFNLDQSKSDFLFDDLREIL